MMKRLAAHVIGGEAQRAEMVQPGEGRLRGDVIAVFNCLMGRGTEKMSTPSNRQKLQQGTNEH